MAALLRPVNAVLAIAAGLALIVVAVAAGCCIEDAEAWAPTTLLCGGLDVAATG